MPDKQVDAARALITAVQSLERRQWADEISRAKELLDASRPIVKRLAGQGKVEVARFNIFEALGVRDNERVHSKFLAYLLDPYASHEQGSDFLHSFLDHFLRAHALPRPTPEETFVSTEFATPFGCLDIAIFLPAGGRICIENKVWASEQEQQISRYQTYLSRLNAGSRSAVVFLSPKGNPPHTIDSVSRVPVVSISYEQMATWLTSLLPKLPSKLQSVLAMYAMLCTDIATEGVSRASDKNER